MAGGSVALVIAGLWFCWACQPRWLARLLARRVHAVVFAADTARREVALTFDDGPHRVLTPALVDALDRHAVTATFFLMGTRVRDAPDLVEQLVRKGHEVANHMWDEHPSALLTLQRFQADLCATALELLRAGAAPALLRPASGWIRPGMLRMSHREGYRVVLGSVAPRDLALRSLDRELRFVVRRIQPGAIIVLHEGDDSRAPVVALTDRLLHALTERGYRAVTVSQLLRPAGPQPLGRAQPRRGGGRSSTRAGRPSDEASAMPCPPRPSGYGPPDDVTGPSPRPPRDRRHGT